VCVCVCVCVCVFVCVGGRGEEGVILLLLSTLALYFSVLK